MFNFDDFKGTLWYSFAWMGIATFVWSVADLISDGVKLRKEKRAVKEKVARINGALSVLNEKQMNEVKKGLEEKGIDLDLLRKQGVEV